MTAVDISAGRVAVVSGGSGGLGRVLVERLLEDGWRVATFSRAASPFIEQISITAGEDFSDRRRTWKSRSRCGFVAGVVRRYQRIDLLINNAGPGGFSLRHAGSLGRPRRSAGSASDK